MKKALKEYADALSYFLAIFMVASWLFRLDPSFVLLGIAITALVYAPVTVGVSRVLRRQGADK